MKLESRRKMSLFFSRASSWSSIKSDSGCKKPAKCAGSLARVAWRKMIAAAHKPSSFSEV